MLYTKIIFEIKDCKNKTILTSKQGESRDKEYEKAYKESFRAALVSMRGHLDFKQTESEVVKSEEVPVMVVVPDNKPETKQTIVVSDNQAYKQFGNSVCIPVIKALSQQIYLYLQKKTIPTEFNLFDYQNYENRKPHNT
jgi:site-specific DNA-cytosine methylase